MGVDESANVGGPTEVSRIGAKADPASGSSSQVARMPTPGFQAYQSKEKRQIEEGSTGTIAAP
eukprot:10362214-Lingulodinium_polyedra.AAC.1